MRRPTAALSCRSSPPSGRLTSGIPTSCSSATWSSPIPWSLHRSTLPQREDTHHLLSRYGMLLISVRGSLFSTLGMHETCNFLSNLNNQHMDVGQANMSVLSKSGTVTFVQLYADAPHIHYNQPFTCSLSHPNFKSTLTSKAHTSLRYNRDLSQDVWECLIQGFTADGIIFLQPLSSLTSGVPEGSGGISRTGYR